ncbi:TPA: hypothetical protein QDB19_004095 [Burkholderia vietnamiensis]|nr:hypothetical protein [Burkholderia vietnamiensis]
MLLQDSLQEEEKDQGEKGAKPDFQKDHDSTPARKATQRNQTQATASPLPNAHRLPLTMYPWISPHAASSSLSVAPISTSDRLFL